MSLRPLEHVDEIRNLLNGPGNGRPRTARCTIPVITRIHVDGIPAIVYDDPGRFSTVRRYPVPDNLTDQVRLARQVYIARMCSGVRLTDAEHASLERRDLARERNLAWLHGLRGIDR